MKKLFASLALVLALVLACTSLGLADEVVELVEVIEVPEVVEVIEEPVAIEVIEEPVVVEEIAEVAAPVEEVVEVVEETEDVLAATFTRVETGVYAWSSLTGSSITGTASGHTLKLDAAGLTEDNYNDSTKYTWKKMVTCTENGELFLDCDNDACIDPATGKRLQHVITVKALGHDFSKIQATVKKAATCEEDGIEVYKCSRCSVTEEKVIEKLGHEYYADGGVYDAANAKYYKIVLEASCKEGGSEGVAQRICIKCGVPETVYQTYKLNADGEVEYKWTNDNIKEADVGTDFHYRTITKPNHTWTKWIYDREGTCVQTGAAHRRCEKCNALQVMDETSAERTGNEVKIYLFNENGTKQYWEDGDVDNKGNATIAGTQKYEIQNALDYDAIVMKKNQKWDTVATAFAKTYTTDAEYQKAYATFKKDIVAEIASDETVFCYTRNMTFVCPYCTAAKKAGGVEGKDYIKSHVDGVKVVVEFPAWADHHFNTTIAKTNANMYTNDPAYKGGAATYEAEYDFGCETERYYYFYCDDDAKTDHRYATRVADKNFVESIKFTANGEDHERPINHVAKVTMGEVGSHKWSEWTLDEEYETTAGKTLYLYKRTCSVCGTKDEDLRDSKLADAPEIKTVDGKLAYVVDGEVAKDYTGAVKYNGKKYAVKNGYVMVDSGEDTQVTLNGRAYIVDDGIIRATGDGLHEYNGGLWAITNGWLRYDLNMLWTYDVNFEGGDGKVYYIQNGQVIKTNTLLDWTDGYTYKIKDGIVDTEFTGTVSFRGNTYSVVNGVVQ